MAVYKRGGVWWVDYSFAGRRVQESAKTERKTIAAEYEKRHQLELQRAYAGLPSEEPVARIQSASGLLDAYRKAYQVNHRDKSILRVRSCTAHVERVMGTLLVPDVTQERIVGYMRRRQQEEASGRTVNLELMTLTRAVGQTWKALWPKVRKLEENHDVGRALGAGEEKAILEAAARGGWIGLTAKHARADLIRSIIEGVCYSQKDCLDIIEELGVEVTSVRVSGGGARSAFWRQLLADVMGKRVVVLETQEGSAYGAALMSLVGTGVYGSVLEVCRASIREVDSVDPRAAERDLYARGHELYGALYPVLKPLYGRM